MGGAGADSIHIHKGADVTVNGGTGNDTIKLNAHFHKDGRLSGSSGRSYGAKYVVQYTAGDGYDTVWGIESDDTLQISGATYTTVRNAGDIIVKVGSGSILLKNAANLDVKIVSGSNGSVSSGGGSVSSVGNDISNSNSYTVISGTNYNDTVFNVGDVVNIDGGNDSDIIVNGGDYVTMIDGAVNDMISVSSHYNLIQYENGDGNDVIYGINSNDSLQITGVTYTTTKSGSDLIVKVGSGAMTLKDAANVALKIKGTLGGGSSSSSSGGNSGNTLPAGLSINGSVLTAASSFKGNKINSASYSKATKVNAAALSSGVSIVGSSANNSLKGGKGADTISGGAGNDTVSLGGGKDIYIYSGGNDLIQDYAAGQDKIKLSSGKITKTAYSGKNVIFTIGGGTLTVKNGKGKDITITDAQNKTTTEKYSNLASSADLFEDDNFIGGIARIDDITEITADKYSVTEMQIGESLGQENKTLITYGNAK